MHQHLSENLARDPDFPDHGKRSRFHHRIFGTRAAKLACTRWRASLRKSLSSFDPLSPARSHRLGRGAHPGPHLRGGGGVMPLPREFSLQRLLPRRGWPRRRGFWGRALKRTPGEAGLRPLSLGAPTGTLSGAAFLGGPALSSIPPIKLNAAPARSASKMNGRPNSDYS